MLSMLLDALIAWFLSRLASSHKMKIGEDLYLLVTFDLTLMARSTSRSWPRSPLALALGYIIHPANERRWSMSRKLCMVGRRQFLPSAPSSWRSMPLLMSSWPAHIAADEMLTNAFSIVGTVSSLAAHRIPINTPQTELFISSP